MDQGRLQTTDLASTPRRQVLAHSGSRRYLVFLTRSFKAVHAGRHARSPRLMPLAASGVSVVALVAATLAPASAASAPPNFDTWVTSDNASVVDASTVRLAVPSDNDSSSIYNNNLNFPVHAGDVVSFRMDTQQGAYCTD